MPSNSLKDYYAEKNRTGSLGGSGFGDGFQREPRRDGGTPQEST